MVNFPKARRVAKASRMLEVKELTEAVSGEANSTLLLMLLLLNC